MYLVLVPNVTWTKYNSVHTSGEWAVSVVYVCNIFYHSIYTIYCFFILVLPIIFLILENENDTDYLCESGAEDRSKARTMLCRQHSVENPPLSRLVSLLPLPLTSSAFSSCVLGHVNVFVYVFARVFSMSRDETMKKHAQACMGGRERDAQGEI